jgi:hypothetical protein
MDLVSLILMLLGFASTAPIITPLSFALDMYRESLLSSAMFSDPDPGLGFLLWPPS